MAAELTDERAAFEAWAVDQGYAQRASRGLWWMNGANPLVMFAAWQGGRATQQATQGAEPVLWVSPEQARSHTNADGEHGRYIPARRTSAGKFTMALYTAPPPTAEVEKDAARYRKVRRGQQWSVVNGIGDILRAEALDAAVDAAIQSDQAQAGKTPTNPNRTT